MIRALVLAVGLALAAMAGPVLAAGTIQLTDIAGRTVTVRQPVERMILGEGRLTFVVALLDRENPFRRVVGWRGDLRTNDLDSYLQYARAFPEIAGIPVLGNPTAGGFNVEAAIALKPDIVVLNLESKRAVQETGLLDRLEAAGIPALFVDFRFKPFENTEPSTRLLGRLLGQDARAEAFAAFHREQIARIDARLAGHRGPRPTVFLERAPGLRDDCCFTFGAGNMGLLIERAGGINIAAGKFSGDMGMLNHEQVLVSDPDVLIATGANWSLQNARNAAVELGYGADGTAAVQRLRGLATRPGFATLTAVRTGRVHAVWHQFYNSPYIFIALQAFAAWLQPALFADVDPDATFRALHDRFLPIPYQPGFWVSLPQ